MNWVWVVFIEDGVKCKQPKKKLRKKGQTRTGKIWSGDLGKIRKGNKKSHTKWRRLGS